MQLSNTIFLALASFVFLILVFRPLEILFPANRKQRFLRPDWLLDVFFFVGQYLFWNGLVLTLLFYFQQWLDLTVPTVLRINFADQPWWLQFLIIIILSDFLVYWGHRLQHRVGFLWRFHKVHHSARSLDWLAAHREHPVDTVYTVGLINLPAFLLGFPIETILGFVIFRGIWAIYIHANVRIPLGPLKILLGAPQLHHWHHDLDRNAGNYANISPLMDVIFGTYRCPGHEPESFGIDQSSPDTYLGFMIEPFLPQGQKDKVDSDSAVKAED